MKKPQTRSRNRDFGVPGHPTQFAPSIHSEPALDSLGDFLRNDTSTALNELLAYREAVESGGVVIAGMDREVVAGRSFRSALDRQIEYASRGDDEADDALRFHQMRHDTTETFTVDGRTFDVSLSDAGDVSVTFTTTVDSVAVPQLAGMSTTHADEFIAGARIALEDIGAVVEQVDGTSVRLSIPSRPIAFNSLPDCASKVVDVELDAFVAADNFSTVWRREHTVANDDWLTGDSVRFVG